MLKPAVPLLAGDGAAAAGSVAPSSPMNAGARCAGATGRRTSAASPGELLDAGAPRCVNVRQTRRKHPRPPPPMHPVTLLAGAHRCSSRRQTARRAAWDGAGARAFDAVEFATLESVDWFNNLRLLAPIGNIPPAEAGARFYAQIDELAMVA